MPSVLASIRKEGGSPVESVIKKYYEKHQEDFRDESGGPSGEAVPIEASGAAGSGVPTSLGDGQPLENSQDAPQDPDAGGDDPQNIGPCPEAYAGIPVVRSGFDELGRETWWHEDGSFTQRFLQTVREADGSSYQVPAVLHAAPSGHRRR